MESRLAMAGTWSRSHHRQCQRPAVPAPERRHPVLFPEPGAGQGQESEITEEREGAGQESRELRFCPKWKMNLHFLEIKIYIKASNTCKGSGKLSWSSPSGKSKLLPGSTRWCVISPWLSIPSFHSVSLFWVLQSKPFSFSLGFLLPFHLLLSLSFVGLVPSFLKHF